MTHYEDRAVVKDDFPVIRSDVLVPADSWSAFNSSPPSGYILERKRLTPSWSQAL
jgi:hypothetical protein